MISTGHMTNNLDTKGSGPWFNIKMSSCQCRKSHCGDKTAVRSSYLHSGISYTGKMTSLYWFDPSSPFGIRITAVWHVMCDPKLPITMTSQWTPWRHKLTASRMFTQPLFRRTSSKISTFRVTGLCEGNPMVTGGFPSLRASNSENICIGWRHNAKPGTILSPIRIQKDIQRTPLFHDLTLNNG